jgi:hypothetical protein
VALPPITVDGLTGDHRKSEVVVPVAICGVPTASGAVGVSRIVALIVPPLDGGEVSPSGA